MTARKGPARSVDVARLAGVSRSAVSRAFTEGAYVSPDTREKVLRAAELLDYRPNVIARSLTRQSTRIIGFATADLRNNFYAHLLQEVSRRLQALGFATLLMVTSRTDTDEAVAQLLGYQVDAMILTAVMLSSGMTARFQQWGKPVILVDRYIESDSITSISGSNIDGAAAVADLFVDSGYERIAFMPGYRDVSSSRDRERGFRERLAARGRLLYACESGDYTRQGAQAATRRLMAMEPRPDALFCANDMMAMQAMDVVREEFGLRVPEDIAIAGYDNSDGAASSGYHLTSVDQNIEGMAQRAVEAVVARLAEPTLPAVHEWVPAQLVQRESTLRARVET